MTDILKYLDEDGVTWKPFTTAVGDAASIGGATLPAILDAIFPVGSPYVSGSPTLPPLIASIGTWVRLNGVVIVGVDESQAEFDTVEKTGGAKTHTLTVAQMPAHKHTFAEVQRPVWWGADARYGSSGSIYSQTSTTTQYAKMESTLNSAIQDTGGGGAHNNLQPYKTKYMWERTA